MLASRLDETPVSPGLATPTEGTEGAQEPREEPFTRDEGEEPERATERRSWRKMLDV